MQYSLITKNSILYELFCPHFFFIKHGAEEERGVMRRKEGGDGLGQGVGGAMGWGKLGGRYDVAMATD